jgi:hypothetical protein
MGNNYMNGGQDKGIYSLPMSQIDVAFQDERGGGRSTEADLGDADQAKSYAVEFREWLNDALGDLKHVICFVDFTVFQDPKIQNPYFYLVSPRAETTARYVQAVKELVEGKDGSEDCFSVAFHPDFVGIGRIDSAETANQFIILSIGLRTEQPDGDFPTTAIKIEDWNFDVYPLWPKKDSRWPPTSKSELRRICGKRSLNECLLKFQSILTTARTELCDPSGRPLTSLFCVPFLILNRPSEVSTSNLPFSEIAAALFLGVSCESNVQQTQDALVPFLRSLALRTYRKGMKTAGEKGKVEGVEQAIETFAHQIKGIASAMSTQWAVDLETWEVIRRRLIKKNPQNAFHLEQALVLPAPELIRAIKDTLVLWSQNRRVADLYVTSNDSDSAWPGQFSDIVERAWLLIAHARFAAENINSNLGELMNDIIKVWGQSAMMKKKPQVIGNLFLPEPPDFDPEAEAWICNITRLLAAIFDNSLEHGNQLPVVNVKLESDQKTVSFSVSNPVAKTVEDAPSRLRLGMKGNEVLQFLAERLQATLRPPDTPPPVGANYIVDVTLRLPPRLCC